MTTRADREEHLNTLRSTWDTMPFADLRMHVLGLVTVQFVLSEFQAAGYSSDRPQRFQALVVHFSTMGELELREATSGIIAGHDDLREEVLAERGDDPALFGMRLLESLLDDLCDAASAALNGDDGWQTTLSTQLARWIRTPPLGV